MSDETEVGGEPVGLRTAAGMAAMQQEASRKAAQREANAVRRDKRKTDVKVVFYQDFERISLFRNCYALITAQGTLIIEGLEGVECMVNATHWRSVDVLRGADRDRERAMDDLVQAESRRAFAAELGEMQAAAAAETPQQDNP